MDIPKNNYVGELQAMCQKAHITMPDYIDESIGDNLIVTCTLKDWVCQGTGPSKKFAKQSAAKQMLDKIEHGNLLVDISEENDKDPQNSSVSKLEVFCVKEKRDRPLYSELPKEDEYFCFKCSIGDFSAVGKGYSKKEAKEKAAFKVAEHFGVHKYYDDLIKAKKRKLTNISPLHELSIFCQKRHMATPTYEEEEIKSGNVVKYKVICSVGDLKEESGLAHSKKFAKCDAATLMLNTLKNNTPLASPAKEDVKPELEDIKPVLKRKFSDLEEPDLETS